jgi:hypothetical protein
MAKELGKDESAYAGIIPDALKRGLASGANAQMQTFEDSMKAGEPLTKAVGIGARAFMDTNTALMGNPTPPPVVVTPPGAPPVVPASLSQAQPVSLQDNIVSPQGTPQEKPLPGGMYSAKEMKGVLDTQRGIDISNNSPFYDAEVSGRNTTLTPKGVGGIKQDLNSRVEDLIDKLSKQTYDIAGNKHSMDKNYATIAALRGHQITGEYGLEGHKIAAGGEKNAEKNAIEREKLAFEISKFTQTNDMKNPLNLLKLASTIAPKKKQTTLDADGNPTVYEEPDVNAGLVMLQKWGYKLPGGLSPTTTTPKVIPKKGDTRTASDGTVGIFDGTRWAKK